MRRTEIIFLLCVFAFAALFVARSVRQTIPLLPGAPPSGSAAIGAAGQPRDVDMPQLKRLLDRRALSGHEAEFYEPVDSPPGPDDETEHKPSGSKR